HSGSGWRRPDDDRLPHAQYDAGGVRHRGVAAAGFVRRSPGMRHSSHPLSASGGVVRARCLRVPDPRKSHGLEADDKNAPPGSLTPRALWGLLSPPGEGDFVERPGAELFRGTGYRAPPQRAVELDGRLVVGQCPDDQALEATLGEVATSRGEKAAAKAQP